jgi:hypothetical protein
VRSPPKPIRIDVPPATTWLLVTMSPLRSSTKPEPSCCTRCCVCGRNGTEGAGWVAASVTTTTPGASAR